MNKLKNILLIIGWVVVATANSYAVIDEALPIIEDQSLITSEELKEHAVMYNVIPKETDEVYLHEQIEKGNSVIVWILMSHEQKVLMIDQLKKMSKEKGGVTINYPSGFYVNGINGVLYNSIRGDEVFSDAKKGVGVIFENIALQEGDYDDGSGQSKIEILKKHLGEEMFELYKVWFPERYKALVDSQ
ncbi:MAG: hypothetical protein JXD21_07250 [Candidatus Omnitrophica bacterium]|nr:hypothetical protein [Candidatus Omnitrophota bacterium]